MIPFLNVWVLRRSVRLLCFFFVFPAGIFSGPRSPFLVALFHFAVPVDALVVAALFLTLSERGRGLNDESPMLDNNGMHGAPAAAKAVVGCADHSLTMVRPAAVLDHSMRPRYKIKTVLEKYTMHAAGSFSRFRYMLLRFELTAAVSSNRSSDYYCCHRPCEPVTGKVCGKGAADTTGFENRERSVSRLI